MVGATCASPLASKRLVPAVPRKSLHPLHAPSTPVAVCPVIRHLTDLSQKRLTPLVLTTSKSFRRVIEGFACARLLDAHLLGIMPQAFLQRSRPRLLTAAAWSGVRPAPESRSRRAYLHLSRSCTTAIVVACFPLSICLCSTPRPRKIGAGRAQVDTKTAN